MAQELIKMGYKDVYALEGGFDAWRQAGLPVESKDAGIMAESAPDTLTDG